MKLTAESTVFNDDNVKDKFAELEVDADGIRTEVGKKVGNDEVISRIRQSAEEVKIQASKIEIDGVITAINNDTTTSINGGKITTGSISIGQVNNLQSTLNGKAASGAENTALNYITDIGDDGIRIHDSHTTNNSAVINSSGMEIFEGGTDAAHSVAKYGDTLRNGKNENAHIEMDYHSMQLKDRGSNTYFHVSDLRDSDGIAVVQNQWTANNNQTSFSTQMPILEVVSVTVNGTETTNYTVSRNYDIEFPSGKSAGDVVIATYKTQSVIAKAYTLGLRKNDSVVGALSHAEGWRTTASGTASHAEGFNATASGAEAHAEGSGTVASGGYSHAEGSDTVASGNFSHAGGMGTIAKGNAQTAIGRYNVKDTNSLFIIGMGYTDQTRSNAFSVSTTGQVFVNGTLVHTSDRRLKEHIAYLDEDADEFIRQLKPAHYIKDDKHHVGFYAQDVDEADKWDCMTGEMNGYMTLGYMELIAPLVAYCQHLEKRIEELENK